MSEALIVENEMKVLIDGQEKIIATDGLSTVLDLLMHIEINVIGKSRVITRVRMNEEELDEGQQIGLGAFPISDVSSLEIETHNSLQLGYEALEDAQEYLPALSTVLEEAAKQIRQGFVAEGLQNASQALELISVFGEVLDSIRSAFQIDYSKIKIDEETLQDKFNELGTLANGILQSAKNHDWTLFADLIEYELSPLLFQWMELIPEVISRLPDPHDGSENPS